jgi:SAM-dependent methyltransferase
MKILKYKSDFDLDDPNRTIEHSVIIRNKSFLRNIYKEWYAIFKKEAAHLPAGKMLEIGSGGGFLKEEIPAVITSDIMPLPDCDMCLSAEALPFKENELSAIFMVNVLHHIKNPVNFFNEVVRTLTPGGVVAMIEPTHSVMSYYIYKNFHHEPFDVKAGWELKGTGPLSESNQALPWILFHRDRKLFESTFPSLKISFTKQHTSLRYILSGGVSRKAMVPAFTFPFFTVIDQMLNVTGPLTSMFETIIIKKQ